jgi:cystathionine beta-lyase
MKFNTKTIHGGQSMIRQGLMPPYIKQLHFAQTSPGNLLGNMNTVELQTKNSFRKCIGEYREWRRGLAFSSGLAATDCLMRGLKAGDEVIWMICMEHRLFTKFIKIQGILFHFVDMNDMEKSSD